MMTHRRTDFAAANAALRPATLSDAPACAVILQDWLDATVWMPKLHDVAETTDWMRSDLFRRAEIVVVEADGAVRGLVAVAQGSIAALYLSEGWRGAGLGGRLVERAKGMSAGGLTLWTFQANAGARRFYARHGFVEVARTEGDNAEGLPDAQLRWPGALA